MVYRIEGTDAFRGVSALKAFFADAYDSLDDFEVDMARMQRIAALIHHRPHDDVVDIDWFGLSHDVYVMQMKYIDGFDLRKLVDPALLPLLQQCVDAERWKKINNVIYAVNGTWQLTLQPAIAVYITERVLRGLGALHDHGIVHGDVKTSNIMANQSGSVKIIDVGSAFEESSPPTRHHFTPAYVAPEFLEDGTMTKQSDLASVGYMLIELLSGKPITKLLPDPNDSTQAVGSDIKQELLEAKRSLPNRLSQILPHNVMASDHLVQLCKRLIEPDLKKRFSTAEECIVDPKGTYAFNNDLILSNLGVCNFQEIRHLLTDVNKAMKIQAKLP